MAIMIEIARHPSSKNWRGMALCRIYSSVVGEEGRL